MPATRTALALLITAADGSHRVLVGSDERSYRHAFGAFVDAWGEEAVWYDDEAKQLGSTGGVSLSRWRVRVLGSEQRLALLVLAGETPVGVYLVDDAEMAKRAVVALDRDGIAFDLVAVEEMPEADPIADSLPLAATIRTRHGAPRPRAPQPRLSDEFCPRCEDHQLCEEPLFDASGDDGGRVCQACARLGSMLESAGRGQSPEG